MEFLKVLMMEGKKAAVRNCCLNFKRWELRIFSLLYTFGNMAWQGKINRRFIKMS
jgi:hypothetical protein